MIIDLNNLKINKLQPQTAFDGNVLHFLENWLSETKTVEVQTSGSTGIPKVFQVEKQRMLHSAKITCDFLNLKAEDTAMVCLPIEYISGKMMVVRAVERNLKLWISEPSTKPLENIESEIDFCAMTPLQVENSLNKIHLIKKLIIGGAEVSEHLKRRISQTLKKVNGQESSAKSHQPSTIYETYGMSETLSHIALKQIFPVAEDYFKTMEEVEISTDERGCLKIFAPKLNSEIQQTNDVVELKNDKEFKFLGRIDHVINSGGAKIFPEELEKFVKNYIPNEIVFLGIPDEILGQKLVLIVEGTKEEKINQQLSAIIYQPKFHKPKEIIFVEKIPRTPNGKINRLKLLEKINSCNS